MSDENQKDDKDPEDEKKKKQDRTGESDSLNSGQSSKVTTSLRSNSSKRDSQEKSLRFVLPEEEEEKDEEDDYGEEKEEENRQEVEIQSVTGYHGRNVHEHGPRSVDSTSSEYKIASYHPSVSSISSRSDFDSRTAFPHAISSHLDSLLDVLKPPPATPWQDYSLILYAYLRNLEGVKQTLREGADPNLVLNGHTPLLIATGNNDKQMVHFLLNLKTVEVDHRSIYGNSALMIAVRNGFDEISSMLIDAGATVDLANNLGRTPLHEATFRENFVLVRLLVKQKHKLDVADCFGERPIYTCSVKKPNIFLLNILLAAGACSEYENETGMSLLSRVILNEDNFGIVRRLVLGGADVNHQDRFCKRSPLHMAAIINSSRTAKFLVDHGSNPNLKTISGLTPFDMALYYRCFETAEYLMGQTNKAAIRMANFNQTLLSRLPHHKSAAFLLKTCNSLSEDFVPPKKFKLSPKKSKTVV